MKYLPFALLFLACTAQEAGTALTAGLGDAMVAEEVKAVEELPSPEQKE